MVSIQGGSGGGGGFDYVQDPSPQNPEEGEEWYDTGSDRAFVYDGTNWIEQTIGDHGQLSGVGPDNHHRPVPTGAVMMWSGATSNIPAGWTLCDGTDGAPDLRNRFVVGTGDQYSDGQTGGASSVQLTESEMPSHSHPITDPGHNHTQTNFSDYSGDGGPGGADGGGSQSADTTTETTGITVDNAGGDQAHENRPPFFALAFIMKT